MTKPETCANCHANAPYARAFDRVLESLERRYEQRQKKHRAAENAVVMARRSGEVDQRLVASYHVESARLETVRLILNAAVREYERARKQR